jgi:DNA (cytosine-5)-methyltransferase 1
MILDLFAGPGGWSLGLRALGLADVGVEFDKVTCDTREALGLQTIHADVRDVPVDAWRQIDGLIASPPCQSFSKAGKQLGLADERGQLVWQPRRFIETHLPRWVAFEEVPDVLPIWREYQRWMESVGYSVWTGLLNAADYGVPQSRTRAFLLARSDGVALPPEPTHAENPHPSLFGETLRPWVTMAEALPHRTDLPDWCHRRPATTVVRSFCPHIIAAPGWRGPGDGPRQNAPGSVTVDIDEMATLQGAWPGMPWQGSKTKRFSLCGALLPPPWAAAILGAVIPSAVAA